MCVCGVLDSDHACARVCAMMCVDVCIQIKHINTINSNKYINRSYQRYIYVYICVCVCVCVCVFYASIYKNVTIHSKFFKLKALPSQ